MKQFEILAIQLGQVWTMAQGRNISHLRTRAKAKGAYACINNWYIHSDTILTIGPGKEKNSALLKIKGNALHPNIKFETTNLDDLVNFVMAFGKIRPGEYDNGQKAYETLLDYYKQYLVK